MPDWKPSFPLSVADPLLTIYSLINALQQIWDSSLEVLSQFDAYRLVNHSVLQGRGADHSWRTILAYCGGWKLKLAGNSIAPLGKCGNAPLYLGDGTGGSSSSCTHCHRLVCPECGHCGDFCDLSQSRQHQFAQDAAGSFSY